MRDNVLLERTPRTPTPTSPDELQKLVAEVPFWWHSINLGGGVVTPGGKSPQLLAQEFANYRLSDLVGQTVLDIGAWDGYFSFQAERLGASRVVALDHYVWSIDFAKTKDPTLDAFDSQGHARQAEDIAALWHPEELPGKRGFDLARTALKSRVEPIVADFMNTDLNALGQFDVVFYLGVLYHMRHPFVALERLAQVTRNFAVIETEAVSYGPLENQAWCEFFENDERNGDPSNWWAPNAKALSGMCRAAGFKKVEILVGPKPEFAPIAWLRRMKQIAKGRGPVNRYRLVARAYK